MVPSIAQVGRATDRERVLGDAVRGGGAGVPGAAWADAVVVRHPGARAATVTATATTGLDLGRLDACLGERTAGGSGSRRGA